MRLLVSGGTDAEVMTASRVLAEMDDRLNRGGRIDALQRDRGEQTGSLLPAHFLVPDRRYPFSSIGEGATFRGTGTFRHALAFDLPPDFYVPESASFKLYLDFGYGAQAGPGSSLNVLLNDQLVHGMPLDQPGGQSFRAYRLDVSARQLRGGSNTLAFEVALRPPQSPEPCTWVSAEYLIFKLQATSSIALPAAGRAVVLPDLGLMADTGYPYLQTGETTADVNLYVADRALSGAALTLSGKLAQAARVPLQGLRLADWPRDTPAAGNHLMIGTPDVLPERLFRDWSAAVGRSQRWPYQSLNDWRALLGGEQPVLAGHVEQTGALGRGTLLAALANPAGEGTVSVVTADSEQQLVNGINTLIEPAIWGQLRGDLATWHDRDSPVHSLQVSGGYVVGDPEKPLDTLRLWLSNNPWYWAIGVLAVAVLAAWLLYRLLLRRNRRQQEQWDQ
ncbi:MAG: cellulose biosynthesis cyclic di-GMP-binding regulatory protein BcsB [Halioglobus sp.]|nr:cellulose biosynthesis cyclic di-GMP-binding regulatory protein BcsB [Halioglobus sp.]